MQCHALIAQVAPVRQNVPPLSRLQQVWASLLGLLIVLLIVAIVFMRRLRRYGRRGWSMSASLMPEEPAPARRALGPDPWIESGRRLDRPGSASGGKKGDTVDIDPGDLSRGDIETDPDGPIDPGDDL